MKLPMFIALALVLILGAYVGYWFIVAGRLQAGINDWVVAQQAAGVEVTIADGKVGGFPLRFRRDFGAATLSVTGAAPLKLAAQSLVAEMRPWDLNTIIFTGRDGSVDSAAGRYQAGAVEGSIVVPKAPPADYHQPFLGFDLRLLDIRMPQGTRAVTTEPIDWLSARGAIMGPVPQTGDLATSLAGWAQAGGIVELKDFAFVQPPLDLHGNGTLALDEAMRPLGALSVTATGLPETIALFEQDGMIDAGAAKTATLMAEGLAKTDEAGRKHVTVSLSLQEGYLWLGPAKLARLPSLGW